MTFRIERDRMQVVWTDGDRDLAYEFLLMEGYELVPRSVAYRHTIGWEQRIEYKTARLERQRVLQRTRVARARALDNTE